MAYHVLISSLVYKMNHKVYIYCYSGKFGCMLTSITIYQS
ncbi:TPA: hypothetical protein MFD65_005505 [Klebsiella pneumoniae]|uniref:Uncharacterized protein n=1 Tax=Klebsiella pneumoniae TaxID=573 RepID=A0A8E6LAG1_KLEPN|nr:hypothetical protein [Klebsiella pneumoniae]OUY22588.1 hypothetical protein BLK91_20275 [Klebsiella pneumoniae]QIV52725.1 hypothetical protein HC233_28590 [Klebsiella pneumoniae]QLG00420.1 hypothetical protein [Klebsiella pneumoniae]QVQ59211.1 hypothetical protein [Klebsiella pneumoniae]